MRCTVQRTTTVLAHCTKQIATVAVTAIIAQLATVLFFCTHCPHHRSPGTVGHTVCAVVVPHVRCAD